MCFHRLFDTFPHMCSKYVESKDEHYVGCAVCVMTDDIRLLLTIMSHLEIRRKSVKYGQAAGEQVIRIIRFTILGHNHVHKYKMRFSLVIYIGDDKYFYYLLGLCACLVSLPPLMTKSLRGIIL